MNNDEYIEFKNLSEEDQRKAASTMTLEELRDLGQLAVPDLKSFFEEKSS